MNGISTLLSICYIINFILIITVVCFERRDPVVSLAWVLCFITFPGIGLIIFMIFGLGLKRHTKKKYLQKSEHAARAYVKINKKLRNVKKYSL